MEILGQRFPAYELFLIGMGAIVFIALHISCAHALWRARPPLATQDREMVGALGVNQAILFTGRFSSGRSCGSRRRAADPPVAVNAQMDLTIITEVFVVTVIGGMGSITGALVAALIIGQLQAFGILISRRSRWCWCSC